MKKRTAKRLAQEAWNSAADAALSLPCSCEDCQAEDQDSDFCSRDSVTPKPEEPLYQAMTNEVRFTYQRLWLLHAADAPLDANTTLQLAWDIVRNARNGW